MTTNQVTDSTKPSEREELIVKALRRAFSLGQTYWQQSDSEYISHHVKANETLAKFSAFIDETVAALLAADGKAGGEVMNDEAKAAVKLAYGHLWHVNNEPAAPIAIYDTEKAAYEARRQLRGLLTDKERGEAINHVGSLIGRYENPV